jgi:nucleotide-binding universal stress UspA family protein
VNEPLRLLIAIAGGEDPILVADVARLLGPATQPVAITLVHVVDIEPRALLGRGPAVRRGPWPGGPGGLDDRRLEEAEQAASTAILATWHERFKASLPDTVTITDEVRRGHPEHEIIAAANLIGADALVLAARARIGPTEPGPRSLGHVARFVVDHAPRAGHRRPHSEDLTLRRTHGTARSGAE